MTGIDGRGFLTRASLLGVGAPVAVAGLTGGRLFDGDPNGGNLPHWPAYDAGARRTLVLGDTTTVQSDPLRDFRLLWANLPR